MASVLLGCWFALFAAELPVLHVCAVHDIHAPMGHMHMSHSSSHPEQHHSHATCTCPGACCPGVGARLATPPELTPARIVAVVEPPPFAPTLLGLAAARIVLPPALGPPPVLG